MHDLRSPLTVIVGRVQLLRRQWRTEQLRQFADELRDVVAVLREANRVLNDRGRLFVLAQKQKYGGLNHARMSVWEAIDKLNLLVDDSDPDTDMSQLEHLLHLGRQLGEETDLRRP